MQKQFKITEESLNKLKEELEFLKTVREREVADQIKEARSFGDLSENSEYDEAKNEQGKLFSRMAELENIISHAVIITEDMYRDDEVSPGCKVLVRDTEDGSEEEFHIVGSQEADPMFGKVSDESPFGKALIGRHIGEIVEVEAPAGVISYEIMVIHR